MATIAKSIFFLIFITKINAEMFPSFSQGGEDPRSPHKIILRSKRQQCVCVSVTFPDTVAEFDPASSSFQCTCDPSSPSTSFIQTPLQRQYQQQQELQRELQQVQQSPRSHSTSCGCQLSPQFTSTASPTTAWSAVSFGTTRDPFNFQQLQPQQQQQSSNYGSYGSDLGGNVIPQQPQQPQQPLFDCQCVSVPQQPSFDIPNQNSIQQNYNPTAYNPNLYNQPQPYPQQQPQYAPPNNVYQPPPPTTTSTTTTTTTPTPIVIPSTPSPSSIYSPQGSAAHPRCKCVEIQILYSLEPQIQCECNGQNGNGNGNGNNNNNNNGAGQETRVPPFLPAPTTTPQSPPGYLQTTTSTPLSPITASTRGAPVFFTTTTPSSPPSSGASRTTTQPDALPCIMIQIRTGQKVCACQENYKQCTENVCCNTGKYSSLIKSNDDPHHPSAGKATVDLLVDLLQKVRETFI